MSETIATPLLVGATEAAKLLSISRTLFLIQDKTGELGPRSVKIGSRRLWSTEELAAWARAGCPARARWATIWGKQ